MQKLCKLIEELHIRHKNAIIWITGDANLPHIDWPNNLVSHSAYPTEIYSLLMDIHLVLEVSFSKLTLLQGVTIYWTFLLLTHLP